MHRFLILLLGVLLLPAPAGADPAAPGTAAVTYVVGGSIYIDAGSEAGLAVGDTVTVIRGDAVAGRLRVEYISSRRASCSVLQMDGEVQVGDAVRFTAREAAPPEVPAARTEIRMRSGEENRKLGLRGRIGARYLTVQDRSGLGEDFSQPSLDLYLQGRDMGGKHVDMTVDLRTRRTYRTTADQESENFGQSRVYRLHAAWRNPAGPLEVSLGRQTASSFASVSLFDGALIRYQKPKLGFGVFAGTQPDPIDLGFSSDIREVGVYGEWHTRPGASVRGAVTGGWVGSYVDGGTNREFLFLRAWTGTSRFRGTLQQELDINRAWRSEVEGESISLTSTYLQLRYELTSRVQLSSSYDNRRQVRLYRDRETPESEFNDRYRQGIRAGIDVRVLDPLRIGASYSEQTGSSDSRAYSLRVRGRSPLPVPLDLSTHHTRYTGPWLEGWMHSLGISRRLNHRLDLELHGGIRRETRELALGSDERMSWWGANLDLGLARGWYALLSGDFTSGADEDNNQFFTSLTYRF